MTLPLLIAQQVPFKILGDIGSIITINSGLSGMQQTGKIITAYPKNPHHAICLARELDRRWPTTKGPAVPSDLTFRAGSAVSLRYGAFKGEVFTNDCGILLPGMRAPNGALVEDFRNDEGQQVGWAVPPIADLIPAGPSFKGPFKVGKHTYLPILSIHSSPRGRVFFGIRLSDAESVLLKVRRRGVGRTFAADPLKAEFDIMRRLNRHCALAPRPIGYAGDSELAFLVMEYIGGESFSQISFRRQVHHLTDLVRCVAQLHKVGYAHRDVKLSNAVVSRGVVRLVDFELAIPFGVNEPIRAGTHGYIPPERGTAVNPSMDVYALGACIAHVLLGCDPASLPADGGRLIGLLSVFEYREWGPIVQRALDPLPERRPSADSLIPLLENLSRRTSIDKNAWNRLKQTRMAKWCFRAAYEAGRSSRRFRQDFPHGIAWRNHAFENLGPAEGINIGSAGLIIGLRSIDQATGRGTFDEDIQRSAEWLAKQPPIPLACGLFTGNAGAAVALAIAGKRFRNRAWITAARLRLTAAIDRVKRYDLFSGAAGVLWAVAIVSEVLEEQTLHRLAAACARNLIRNAELRSEVRVWPGDESDGFLTGAAHGAAGIALGLAMWGRSIGEQQTMDIAIDTLRRLFVYGRVNGRITLRRSMYAEKDAMPALPWCHGLAGYGWCMLQAFGDDARLRRALDWTVRRCSKANIVGPPVYCHGAAGELEFWRLLRKYPRFAKLAASRASRAAWSLRLQVRRRHNLCFWGAETSDVVTPDLWVGFLGPATALALYARGISESILSATWLRACSAPKL